VNAEDTSPHYEIRGEGNAVVSVGVVIVPPLVGTITTTQGALGLTSSPTDSEDGDPDGLPQRRKGMPSEPRVAAARDDTLAIPSTGTQLGLLHPRGKSYDSDFPPPVPSAGWRQDSLRWWPAQLARPPRSARRPSTWPSRGQRRGPWSRRGRCRPPAQCESSRACRRRT